MDKQQIAEWLGKWSTNTNVDITNRKKAIAMLTDFYNDFVPQWVSLETPPEPFVTVLLDFGEDTGVCSRYYSNVDKMYFPHFKFLTGLIPERWQPLPPSPLPPPQKKMIKDENTTPNIKKETV